MSDRTISFEMFPPADDADPTAFERGLDMLGVFEPSFLSITYGANGGGRARSEAWIARLMDGPHARRLAGHVTAAGRAKDEVDRGLLRWKERGLTRVVALRGDPPQDDAGQCAPYACAAELAETTVRLGFRDVSVACYPEGHPRSISAFAEMDHLKRKLEVGAHRAISQFFFDVEKFLAFRDRCHRFGITAPIVPGLLVPSAYGQARRFALKCGASVPRWMDDRFAGLDEDPATSRQVAVATTVTQAERLQREGCGHIHLYSMNRFSEAAAVARCLGFPARRSRVLSKRKVA